MTIPRCSPAEILAAVLHATGESPETILSDKRTQGVSYARFLAMLLYSESRPMHSNHEVAMFVGKVDSSTGRHGLMRARYLMENDPSFQRAHDAAMDALNKPAEFLNQTKP